MKISFSHREHFNDNKRRTATVVIRIVDRCALFTAQKEKFPPPSLVLSNRSSVRRR